MELFASIYFTTSPILTHMRRQVILMSEEVRAIQCRSCGGAMYSDQKTASYVCAFCGSSVPWKEEAEFWVSPITFRHKPVQVIDGAMKLGHVEVMSAVNCTAPSRSRQRCKNRSDKSCADCSDSALDTLRSARHVRMICQGSGYCDEDLPFVQQPLFSFPSPLAVLSKKQAHRAQPIPFTARTS